MKSVRLLFACGASYVAMTAHAHADPVSLLATAIHGFLLSSTAVAAAATGTIATIAANVIVGGALIGISIVGGRQQRSGAVNAADAKSTFETSESSVIEGLGRVRVGGMKAFGNTDGSTRWRLVCRLQGPIDAVENYYVGGREVTIDSDGSVTTPPWARPGGAWMKIEDKKGDGAETAWGVLVSAFPSLWTADHQVRGIAQSLVTYYNPGLSEEKYLALYQNGVPDTEEVQRASLIYDPRTGLTAWSDNGIICAAHVLRRDPAFVADRFDWSLISQEADRADGLVATKTGTEKRARCSGMWAWEGARKDTMEDILRSIGAEIRMTTEGRIWFELIDDDPLAEIAFTPRDFIDFDWACGPEAVERPNICRVSYYAPERNYEMADLDMTGIAWARVDDEVTQYGPKIFDVVLPFQPSAAIAQRIARRLFRLARAESGIAVTNMAGLAAWGKYYGTMELPDLGDVEKVRMLSPRVDDGRGSVEIPFSVWPDLPAWNPETDEADAPDPIPEMAYESTLPTPDAPTAMVQITYPVSGAKEFRIAYALPGVSFDTAEATCRVYTGGLPGPWLPMAEQPTFAHITADFLGQTVDARVRIFAGDEGSYFSPVFSQTGVVDDTPCGLPTHISGDAESSTTGNGTINVTVEASELRCASIRLSRRWGPEGGSFGSWSIIDEKDLRPGEDATFSDTYTNMTAAVHIVEWKLTTMTSGGIEGAPLVYSIEVSNPTP
ncbi:hypothetical protein [Shinella zoogloeoides]|uniref:hypothetical protein n=1 Tax=Shinella zoogloeoides TaxID=352475 RepID=UPI00273FEAD6|nr:hypothetical protein [Shinella zoogloeoides]WLR92185.1 hypothetical protein Q9316_17215 [Shinella zoogloeoides]